MLEVRLLVNGHRVGVMQIGQTGDGASGGTHRNYAVNASHVPLHGKPVVFRNCNVLDHDRELPVWELIRKAIEGLAL